MSKLNSPYMVSNGGVHELDYLKFLSLESSTKRYGSMFEYMKEVAEELGQEQQFYTLDLADILWKVQQWKAHLPNVKIYYAVKANPDRILLRLLVKLGLSFDCASEGEIRMVLGCGASPKNIIYAHTVKTNGGLKYASKVGVDLMTFDSEFELLKIHRIYPNARLLLRIIPEAVQCSFDLSDKFGCSMPDARRLITRAKELGMDLIGISFHVGALCTDPQSFYSTIRNCRILFDEARLQGFTFKILDIGGGFFGASGTEGIFHQITDGIKNALEVSFRGNDVELIAEPGCYLSASAFTLVSTVLGKKIFNDDSMREDTKIGVERAYYINDSIYGSFFRDFHLYDVNVKPLVSKSKLKERGAYKSKIFGRTCCSEDVIGEPRVLPDMEIGECLVWENMGAYNQAVCSTFCAVPLPVTRYVFKQNPSLNLDWINNPNEVACLIRENAVLIEGDYQNGHS